MLVDICSICYNESLLLPTWIERWLSVPFVNKIYLVDGGSTDKSVEIAKSYDRVSCITIPWKNDFARQRNVACKLARAEWLIQPDIDEIPCGNLDMKCIPENLQKSEFNQIVLPYIKFYDWDKLWFFINGSTPRMENGFVYPGSKSTITIFRRGHLVGYQKNLHEMPVLSGQERSATLYTNNHISRLGIEFLVGHCDQLKHFQDARTNGITVEESMGLKRARYRLISDAVYDGKVYNKEWAIEAFKRHKDNDKSMIEELGAAQLKSFMNEHVILQDYDAKILWEKVK
jgi:glycosyltransferase involved in cell wall biosynthesis